MTKYLDELRRRNPVSQERLPPGQVLTTKWPVLHYGDVPRVDTRGWTFDVSGLVDRPFTLTYDELVELPRKSVHCDIHCVTGGAVSTTTSRASPCSCYSPARV